MQAKDNIQVSTQIVKVNANHCTARYMNIASKCVFNSTTSIVP